MSRLKKIFSITNMGDKGFTVTEFLVAFALIAVLITGMIKLFAQLSRSYTTQNVAANVQQVVRTGLDIMTLNIRMAGYNPLRLRDVGIKNDFSHNNIHFSYDLNADGIVDDKEDVRFFHEDRKLKKQYRAGYRLTLVENVADLKFSYLDSNDNTAGNRKDIKTVIISMTVTEPAGRGRSLSRTYSTRVICRNLGL